MGTKHELNPDDREWASEEFSEAVDDSKKSPTAEFRFRQKDESYRWLAIRGNDRVDNPAIEGYVLNSRNITKRKEREQKLQRKRKRIDEYAGVVSHDLRNPLNVAMGRLDLAAEDCESEQFEAVEAAHNRMQNIIADVLTLARVGETVGETDTVDLGDLIFGCWRNLDTKSAELLARTDAAVRANTSRLKQLFENLFRNSVEHGGDDVTVTVGDFDDGFYLEADGPGIPEGDRKEVFVAGYSTLDDGTGFGLSIVNEIIRSHDWEIRVTEGSEGGSRYKIAASKLPDINSRARKAADFANYVHQFYL